MRTAVALTIITLFCNGSIRAQEKIKENNMNTVREKILEVAMVLFHKQGYQQTGINQIIKESNIAKASLYYHFITKEALFIAFLHEKQLS